jgi:MtN3 and saliva related transmembrane protein
MAFTLITEIVGSIGATLTTISTMPQAVKAIRTKHTADLSLAMYIMLSIGICFWLAYGVMLEKWPIIIANIVSLPPVVIILIMKLKRG